MREIILILVFAIVSCGEKTNNNNGPDEKSFIDPIRSDFNRSLALDDYFSLIQEKRIRSDIKWLSSYKTRYYKAPEGVKSVKDLKKKWEEITKNRNDINIQLINHKWPQPSLKLTIKGSVSSEIIVGGHIDSINTDNEGIDTPAPGADDNASGISVMTEILRVLIAKDFAPKHQITFFAYAAEEVGLKGSFEIAAKYSNSNTSVKGVLQLDGTNYNGSAKKIVLISDNTNVEQNQFIGNLIDKYIQVPWGYDTCGYACSDHYPWTYNGYIASYPFEAYVKEENPYIHTIEDTLENMFNSASHSVYFAKLGLAFIIEKDKL